MATCRTENALRGNRRCACGASRAGPDAGSHLLRSLLLGVVLILALPGFSAKAVASGAQTSADTSRPVLVAAASDLRFALDELIGEFQATTGYNVRVTYGSTGNFTHQIREGAPFQLFLAADERYVASLAENGVTRDQGTLYAVGRLALVAPRGSLATSSPTLEQMLTRLRASPGKRFAIANPSHAPYGERAREALQHRGLWGELQPQLVLGENVSQAAQFALSGNTVGGLIAWSLALAPPIAARADTTLVPVDWHRPLKQRMVLLHGAGAGAVELYDYLQQAPARAILKRFGFTLPP